MRRNTSMVEDVQAIYSVVQIDSSSEKWLKLSKYFDQTMLIKNSVNLDYGSSCHVRAAPLLVVHRSENPTRTTLNKKPSILPNYTKIARKYKIGSLIIIYMFSFLICKGKVVI
jgi:hypothetical protein